MNEHRLQRKCFRLSYRKKKIDCLTGYMLGSLATAVCTLNRLKTATCSVPRAANFNESVEDSWRSDLQFVLEGPGSWVEQQLRMVAAETPTKGCT